MPDINEIIPKSAIDGIAKTDTEITKLDNDLLKLVNTILKVGDATKKADISIKELQTVTKTTEKNVKKLTEEEKKLQQIEKQTTANTEKVIRARVEAAEKTKQMTAKIKEAIAAEKREVGSIDALRAANKKLTKIRNATTTATEKGRKKIEMINKKLDQNNAKIKANADHLTRQKMTVGGYTESIKAALMQLGLMPPVLTQSAAAATTLSGGMKSAAVSTSLTSKAMKIFKIALISTGIGAIVVALGSLIAYLTETASGTSKLAKAMAPLKAILSTITSLAKKFGEAIALFAEGKWNEGFKLMKNAVKGAGDEYMRQLDLQKQLAVLEEELHQKRKASILSMELQRAKMRDLLKTAKDEKVSLKERVAAQKEAMRINKEVAQQEQDISALEVAILTTKSQMSEDSREEEIALEEARAKHAQILTKLNKQSATYITYLGTLEKKLGAQKDAENKLKDATEARLDAQLASMLKYSDATETAKDTAEEFYKMEDEQDVGDDPVIARTIKRYESIVKFAKAADAQILSSKEVSMAELQALRDKDLISEEEYQAAKIKMEEDTQAKRLEITRATLQALEMAGDFFFQQEANNLNQLSAMYAKKKAHELELAAGNQEAINKINEKYAKKEAELKTKQAKNDKNAALFKAIINTATAITNMLSSSGPAGFILSALAAVIGAIQIGIIASQPIPKFYKGTENAPPGLISVGERGRELIETDHGSFLATQPTITSGLEGAKIYSNPETEKLLAGRTGFDSIDLREVVESNRRVEQAIKDKRELKIIPEKRTIIERQGNYYKKYFNVKLGI